MWWNHNDQNTRRPQLCYQKHWEKHILNSGKTESKKVQRKQIRCYDDCLQSELVQPWLQRDKIKFLLYNYRWRRGCWSTVWSQISPIHSAFKRTCSKAGRKDTRPRMNTKTGCPCDDLIRKATAQNILIHTIAKQNKNLFISCWK